MRWREREESKARWRGGGKERKGGKAGEEGTEEGSRFCFEAS